MPSAFVQCLSWGATLRVHLLEKIISFLPSPTVLTRAQRVSKLWKTVIDTSPTIQTKLWFKSQGTGVASPTGLSSRGQGFPDHIISLGTPTYSGSYEINELFLNSIDARAYSYPVLPIRRILAGRIANGLQRSIEVDCQFRCRSGVEVDAAQPTWLNMHVTEPPVTTVLVVVYDRRVLGMTAATVRAARGVTFCLIMDAIQKIETSRLNGSRWVPARACFIAEGPFLPPFALMSRGRVR